MVLCNFFSFMVSLVGSGGLHFAPSRVSCPFALKLPCDRIMLMASLCYSVLAVSR